MMRLDAQVTLNVVLQSSAGFWIHERLLRACVCVCKETVKNINLSLVM